MPSSPAELRQLWQEWSAQSEDLRRRSAASQAQRMRTLAKQIERKVDLVRAWHGQSHLREIPLNAPSTPWVLWKHHLQGGTSRRHPRTHVVSPRGAPHDSPMHNGAQYLMSSADRTACGVAVCRGVQAVRKREKAERDLERLDALLRPVQRAEDIESITEEERYMFTKLGRRMRAELELGECPGLLPWPVAEGLSGSFNERHSACSCAMALMPFLGG